jgi:hypothetical protein
VRSYRILAKCRSGRLQRLLRCALIREGQFPMLGGDLLQINSFALGVAINTPRCGKRDR